MTLRGSRLPASTTDQRLLDATQTWLDTHPEAPSGLRRTVAENRDTVARALAAQRCSRTS